MFSWGKKTGNGRAPDPKAHLILIVDEAVAEVEDRFQKKLDALEFEWNETYEKFQRLHMKLSKRDKRESAIPPDGETAATPAEPSYEGQMINPGFMRLLNRG